MSGNIQIRLVQESEKSVLRQLMELYSYDFSEFTGIDVNLYGFYGYRYLDHYWTEAGRSPFFVLVDGKLAGFVLVNDHCHISKEDNARSIGEFFIMRKYRKTGVGSKAAALIFQQFTAHWEILVHPENQVADKFWQKMIEQYTDGNYLTKKVVTEDWEGTGYTFFSQINKR
ncbi:MULTISPECIES: GNAT family N-acetyltransferase [Gracilibacillus]|uniref:GNAT family N-acetyltransferase n=1 Tax=Gracilibacillus TaxID=74385 RepID=UPI000826E220|nr:MULTISPECIES: GNAT family N-acetyltransferase [Gracilibacillus]